MGIERKLGRNETLKREKLAKTRLRRERLDSERRQANTAGRARNDLFPELVIREVEIASLTGPRNQTRRSVTSFIEQLMSSISRYGFVQPILIAGTQIVDGQTRVRAADKLGLSNVPAIDVSHMSEPEIRTLRLMLNRSQEQGEWDIEQLRIEFLELIDLGIDLNDTGFSIGDQDIILMEPLTEDTGGDEPEVEVPSTPVTRPGDIWRLGAHLVICGDALDEGTYSRLLGDEQAHMVLTDPPYNVKIHGNVSGLGKKVHGEFMMASGELDESEWQAFLDQIFKLLASAVVDNAVLFAFMDWRSIHRMYGAGFAAGLQLLNLVVWYKQTGGMGSLYRSSHELLPVFCKGSKPRVNNVNLGAGGRDRANTWSAPGANQRGSSANEMLGQHSTPKPVEICVDAILDVTNRGEIVLDAFLGSGTTLIAAEQTGRICRAIELDPKYVDVAVRRWEMLVGADAVLESTGQTFAEVAEMRVPDDENYTGDDE